jgi:hypothetical protein
LYTTAFLRSRFLFLFALDDTMPTLSSCAGSLFAFSIFEVVDLSFHSHSRADRLKSKAQLEAAFAFLSAGGSTVDDKFAGATGIGIVITEEDVVAAVRALLEGEKEALLANRYRTNVGMLLGQLGATLKWADGKLMKKVMDQEVRQFRAPRCHPTASFIQYPVALHVSPRRVAGASGSLTVVVWLRALCRSNGTSAHAPKRTTPSQPR